MLEGTASVPAKKEKAIAPTREESRHITPPVDIYETEESLVVVADMAGVEKDNLDVNVDNGILTIKGHPQYKIRGMAIDEEFRMFDYYRQFQLSEEIDQGKIRADFKNGILTLDLPKMEKAKPKSITVNLK